MNDNTKEKFFERVRVMELNGLSIAPQSAQEVLWLHEIQNGQTKNIELKKNNTSHA